MNLRKVPLCNEKQRMGVLIYENEEIELAGYI